MKGFYPSGLYGRIVFLVSLIIIASFMTFSWLTTERQTEMSRDALKQSASKLTEKLADGCIHYLIISDYAGLEELLLRYIELPEIMKIQVCGREGRVLSEVFKRSDASPIERSLTQNSIKIPQSIDTQIIVDNNRMIVWRPIISANLLGWVNVSYSLEHIHTLNKNTWFSSLILAVLWIFFSIILFMFVLKRPARAIQRLSEFARQLGESKGAQINIKEGSLEVIELCSSLNHASTELQVQEQELNLHREHLETLIKERTAALAEIEKNYSLLFNAAEDAIFVVDMEGKFIDINKTAYERLGYTREEMLGLDIQKLDSAEFAAKAPDRLAEVSSSGQAVFESAHRRKDGTIMPVEVNARVFDYEGRKAGLSIARDITERKKADKALRESEEKFRNLFNNSEVGMFRSRLDGSEMQDMNQKFLDIVGMTREETQGRPAVVLWADPKEREEMIRRLVAGGRVAAFEYKVLNKRDGVRNCLVSAVLYPEQEILEGSISDITELKKAEQQVKQSLREKEALLREIHHRVKNNMAVVSGLLSLQAKAIKDDTVRSLFEESQQRVRSMALVHEKLYQTKDLSSINFEDYIKSIISEIVSLYRIDTSAITMKINIEGVELDLESAVPCGLIINELLTNAFKHAFPGHRSGVLSVHFAKIEDTYTLTIKDNGVGLPEGFDYKEAETLGLRLVKVLTGQLSGTLQIKSDKGTEAVVTFKTERD